MCSDTALGRRSVCPETVFDSFRQNREQPGKLVALRLPVIPLKSIHASGAFGKVTKINHIFLPMNATPSAV